MFFLNKQSKNCFYQYRVAILSILIILSILTVSSQYANAYTISNYWICKDVDESVSPPKPIDPTTIFYDTDEEVYLLFILEDVTISRSIIVKWYDPEDKLFDTFQHQLPDPRSEGYDYWIDYSYYDYLFIKDDDPADMPGQWKVEVYIDDNKEFTELFEIRSTTTTPTTTTTSSPTHSPTSPTLTPSPILPEEEMSTTITLTSTPNQEEEKQVEQSSFLSNPLYIMLIVLSIIVIITLIVIYKRKKPITSQTQQIPNKHCINCGALAQPGEIFCGSCGKRVE